MKVKCSICKNKIEGRPHNAYPFKKKNKPCCFRCNNNFVIPLRFKLIIEEEFIKQKSKK